jgi:hypothetical protein
MVKCPLCKKENDESTRICSCGKVLIVHKKQYDPEIQKIFDDPKYQTILNGAEKRFNRSLLLLFILPFALYFGYKAISSLIEYNRNQKRLSYEIIHGYIRLDQRDFKNGIDDLHINRDKNKVKGQIDNSQGVLFIHKDNADEQIIVYEKPVPLIENESDANKFLNKMASLITETGYSMSDDFNYSMIDHGKTKFHEQNTVYYPDQFSKDKKSLKLA